MKRSMDARLEKVCRPKDQFILKEKKTQSKCMFRLGDDDIESPYKYFLDTFDFFV